MGLEQRPYVGTWRLSGQSLVSHTPDALVYINGDTSIPGCPKCRGKIDLQKFITEVSVDAGTESGSASATFTLSFPLHHTDSFARDAKFILRPGLEVHIYMRGYFPVQGLYSTLAEAQPKVAFQPGATAGLSPSSEFSAPVRTQNYSPESFLSRGEKMSDLSPQQVAELNKLASNMETLHQYTEQLGREGLLENYGGGVYVGNTDAYSSKGQDNHVENSQHYQGRAIDLNVTYQTTSGKRVQVPFTTVWASTMKLRGNKMSQGGVGAYIRAQPNAGAPAGSTQASDYTPTGNWGRTPPHYDTRGKAENWYWYTTPEGKTIQKGGKRPEAFDAVLESLPVPDETVFAWNEQSLLRESEAPAPQVIDSSGQAVDGLGRISAFIPMVLDALEEQSRPEAAGQVEGGASLLQQMGLDGMGIENTLAHPYYHVFHGVITEVNHSYNGGVNSVSVTCNSMLHFWQYHNMSTNASVFGARPTNSKNKMTLVGNNFAGMHPYAIMYSLHYDMAGAAGGVGFALASKTNQTSVAEGGDSLFSLNVQYWEKRFSRGTKLRMHGATGELFSTMSAAWLSRNSSSTLMKALRSRYSDPAGFSQTNIGQQMMATGLFNGANMRNAIDATRFAAQQKPDESNKARFDVNVLEMQAFVSDLSAWGQVNLFESTYESKLDVALKVCEVTGFEFFQDVDGDFVFKPPMWNLDTSTSRVYRLEDIDLISISFSEKEPQVTYMTVKGSHFKNLQGTGLENEWGVKGQYIDYRLVAQFGWRPGSFETSYFNDPRAMFFAAVNRMDVMNIGMQAANATIPVRPELRPGYPVYIPYLDCYYYCNSFTHSHSVGGQCTTSLQLVGKRAKFYAPGRPGEKGLAAIDLGDTLLPERPLEVLGTDGKPRLSGFPNVVMALDPTAINPLFFVVGSDIEDISDARVVKNLLDMGVKLGVLRPAKDNTVDGQTYYTLTRSVGVGDDAQPTEVRFFFDTSAVEQTGSDISILAGAAKLAELRSNLGSSIDTTVEALDALRQSLADLLAEDSKLRQAGSNAEGPEKANMETRRAEIAGEIRTKEKSLTTLSSQKEVEKREEEKSWRSGAQGQGVALLLEIIEQTTDRYRSQADFRGRTDMASTANLLDMLSDKKAIFSNGQQPGQYRYYSASHPDPKQQGPRVTSYDGRRLKDDDPKRLSRPVPDINMLSTNVSAPWPGAAIPEAAIVKGKPTVGIQVLTGDNTAGGEVLPTSDITELMFSVQDVTVVKYVDTGVQRRGVTGIGKAAEKKIQETLGTMTMSPTPTASLQTIFGTQWTSLQTKATAAFQAMSAAAQKTPSDKGGNSGRPVDLTGLSAPTFPAAVQIGKSQIKTDVGLDTYTWDAKATLSAVLEQASASLASSFSKQLNASLNKADAKLRAASTPGDVREPVIQAFNQQFTVGAPVMATSKGKAVKSHTSHKTAVSPVFPVSDAKGYHVVGSYRYGRGVDIDPEGVFAQIHKYDIFQMLDRKLVDQIVRAFIQGEPISVPVMEEVDAGNGKKKTVPVMKTIRGAEAAQFLNTETLAQLRAANLTDKQILDYSAAFSKGRNPNQLDFNLGNFFTDNKLDGVQKVPVVNAAFSLADLNFQQAGHVCDCKAAEANVLLAAFGQEEFVGLSQAGSPAHEGLGSDPADAATRWVAGQAELAATTWAQQQQALRGQVLDRQGSNVVKRVRDMVGADDVDSFVTQATDQAEKDWDRLVRAKDKAARQQDDL